MVAKSEKVSKTVLALPPFDVTAAVSAASQWRGIGFDQSKGHFKVWLVLERVHWMSLGFGGCHSFDGVYCPRT